MYIKMERDGVIDLVERCLSGVTPALGRALADPAKRPLARYTLAGIVADGLEGGGVELRRKR